MKNKVETWKKIPGYPNYMISNIGRVKSLKRSYQVIRNGKTYQQNRKERLLKAQRKKDGYYDFEMSENGKRIYMSIHRAIALAFIRKKCSKMNEVNHINGNPSDNRIENLEWVTHSQNIKHAIETGLQTKPVGEKNPRSKLNEQDVLFIRSSYLSSKELSAKFGVSVPTIIQARNGHTWSHLPI